MKIKDLLKVLREKELLIQVKKGKKVIFLENVDIEQVLSSRNISRTLLNKEILNCKVVNMWIGDMFIFVECKL